VAQAMASGNPSVVVPGQVEHDELVRKFVEAAWLWGQHDAREELKKKRFRNFNMEPPTPVGTTLKPKEAIEWAARRTVLQGKWHRDLDAKVTQVIVHGLETGASNQQVMQALTTVFPKFSKARLENIVRTESMAAYNQGILNTYRTNRFIVAVQFNAILDARTTSWCRNRDGLVMKLDDDRLAANTPPLHYQCRSVLTPMDEFDFEDLQNGDPKANRDWFSHVSGNGPKNITQALAAWDGVPPAQAGFGSVPELEKAARQAQAKKPKPPEAPQPAPTLAEQVKAAFASKTDKIEGFQAAGKLIREQVMQSNGVKGFEERKQALDDHASTLLEQAKKSSEALQAAMRKLTADPELQRLEAKQKELMAARVRASLDGNDLLFRDLDRQFKAGRALIQEKQDVILKPLRDARAAILDEARILQTKAIALRDEEAVTRQKAITSVLSQVREVTDRPINLRFASGSRQGKEALVRPLNVLPDDWKKAMERATVSQPATVTFRTNAREKFFPGRAAFLLSQDKAGTLHEVGHWLEEIGSKSTVDLEDLLHKYRERRTAGERLQRMRDLTGIQGYKVDEVAKPDRFENPYFGRIYQGLKCTELFSMGLESVYYGASGYLEKDAELADLIYGLLALYEF